MLGLYVPGSDFTFTGALVITRRWPAQPSLLTKTPPRLVIVGLLNNIEIKKSTGTTSYLIILVDSSF